MTAGDISDSTNPGARGRIDGNGFSAEVVLSGLNRRIQVLEYEGPDLVAMVANLETKARELDFDKVFLKAPGSQKGHLEAAGMLAEATITGYFAGRPAAVMSKFLSRERRQRPFSQEQESILESIRSRPADPSVPQLPEGYEMRLAGPHDVEDLAELYRNVFASYPFPITDPAYLAATMESNVVYRIVRDQTGKTVAAASAETAPGNSNAEMTDFATLPDQRGLGLAQHLLASLEGDMLERRITNLYTIARARSAGMNRVFHNRSYTWTGTLVNNCHIAGRFEDMHVWCKTVDGAKKAEAPDP
jgi:putative beta-lysine N-acetyltransferase